MNRSDIERELSAGGERSDKANLRVERAIRNHHGNMRQIAETLGVSRSTLYRMFQRKRGYLRLVKQAREG